LARFAKKERSIKKDAIIENTGDWNGYVKDYLNNPEDALAYLQASLDQYFEDEDMQAFLLALRNLAKAEGGLTRLAKLANVNRESLYKTLSARGNPQFKNIMNIIKSLGLSIKLEIKNYA